MHQLKDSDIRKVLENYIHSACTATGTDFLEYCPKLMGRIKRYESMKSGYYIQIQNFDDVYEAKKSESHEYFRYTFRCIQFRERDEYLLEISKWTADKGGVDNDVVIWRSDKSTDGKFLERMITAINMVKYGL